MQMMNSESNFESVLPTIKAKISAIGASYQVSDASSIFGRVC